MTRDEFDIPPEVAAMRKQVEESGLTSLTSDFLPWADGAFRDRRVRDDGLPHSFLRIHRDGAIGMAVQHGGVYTTTIARALNAQLAYFSWVWRRLGLRNPVEIEFRLDGLASARMRTGDWHERDIQQPVGVSVAEVILRTDQYPWELGRPRVRHLIIRDFIDRIAQAFGLIGTESLFRRRVLYWREAPVTCENRLSTKEGGNPLN